MDQVRALPRIHDLVQMLVDGFCGGVHSAVRELFVDDVIFECEHFVAFAPRWRDSCHGFLIRVEQLGVLTLI